MGMGCHGDLGIQIHKTDYYVGENRQVLPGKYKKWIGVSKREHLIKHVSNGMLKNAVDQLYRPGSFIGDGGTASVLKFEKRTGVNVSKNPKGHYIKAIDTSRYIRNRILKENLSNKDRKTAEKLYKQLQRAILEWEGKI